MTTRLEDLERVFQALSVFFTYCGAQDSGVGYIALLALNQAVADTNANAAKRAAEPEPYREPLCPICGQAAIVPQVDAHGYTWRVPHKCPGAGTEGGGTGNPIPPSSRSCARRTSVSWLRWRTWPTSCEKRGVRSTC